MPNPNDRESIRMKAVAVRRALVAACRINDETDRALAPTAFLATDVAHALGDGNADTGAWADLEREVEELQKRLRDESEALLMANAGFEWATKVLRAVSNEKRLRMTTRYAVDDFLKHYGADE